MRTNALIVTVFLWLLVSACGGGASNGERAMGGRPFDAGHVGRASGTAGAPAPLVEQRTGPIDVRLAERGDSLFQSKGCSSCHTFGAGKRLGPDLAGITERVDFAWLYHWLTATDSMRRVDSVAHRLVARYIVPMPDLRIGPEEFEALYEYLRWKGTAGRAP